MQVDATRADAGTAAARLLKTALQQSIKSTSETPKAAKPLKTVQGPPPEFKPRKEINMGYSIGESSVPHP
jgi:hypothetical protein